MKKILSFLCIWLRLGIIKRPAAGMTTDNSALFGLIAMQSNLNLYAVREMQVITTAGTNSNVTSAQAHRSVIRLDAGASGGFTLTLPSTASILSAIGPTIPTDGTFAKVIQIVNNNVGQTATLTAGDASTTVTGTATVATNTVREFLMTVLTASTISYENIGSKTL